MQLKQNPPRILVVDDEKDMLETCRKMLSLHSCRVETEDSPLCALERCRHERFDLVIVDLKMPDMSGLELLREIRKLDPDQIVLMITAYASVENAIQAVRAGAFDFVRKPFKMDDLMVVVERAHRVKALQDENSKLREQLRCSVRTETIIGKSRPIQGALSMLRKVCEVDVSVLLSGESGTGKELFAATIHENSHRRDRPFVVIDCAALPDTLLESELFGYQQGAFTGAVRSKAGLLESAGGGTVFLDEIGEMSVNLQAKLLRAIQEKCVRRLGSNREIPVDIRVLAATNRNLQRMVERGEFRDDLFYRINVVHIRIPPLRIREGDIPLLANHFFKSFSGQLHKKLEGIAAAAMLVMERYGWPGNVRELRNTIERACTLTDSAQIQIHDLPEALLAAAEEHYEMGLNQDFHRAKHKLMEDFESKYLKDKLIQTQGNVSEAAHLAGLSRPAFHRMLKRCGIVASDFRKKA